MNFEMLKQVWSLALWDFWFPSLTPWRGRLLLLVPLLLTGAVLFGLFARKADAQEVPDA